MHVTAQTIGSRSYWTWNGAEDWKNDILVRLQKKLLDKGVPKQWHRYFVQQIIQENGRLDPLYTKGDYGYAYGLGQWYSSTTPARIMLQRDAVKKLDGTIDREKELERQIDKLAGDMAYNWNLYPGDITRAIAAHNRPGDIAKGDKDACRYVRGRGYSCYFRDEVNGPYVSSLVTLTNL